jgi:tryptophanyl-tRNA synthetase
MRANYINGGWGYGHTKKAILELILSNFSEERNRFAYYMNNLEELENILLKGAKKASAIADAVLSRVRVKIGY